MCELAVLCSKMSPFVFKKSKRRYRYINSHNELFFFTISFSEFAYDLIKLGNRLIEALAINNGRLVGAFALIEPFDDCLPILLDNLRRRVKNQAQSGDFQLTPSPFPPLPTKHGWAKCCKKILRKSCFS